MKRVLLMAEAVTLAHAARLVALAEGLRDHEVHLAVASRFDHLLGPLPHVRHDLASIGRERFLTALACGAPVYDAADLRRYVQEDLRLLELIRPDVVVGDFRLSLSVSARLTNTPYATITNIHWSPHARQRFPRPELPFPASALFPLFRPLAFAMHARPLNRVRREQGLPSLGADLRRTYTDADLVLYADAPELAPPHDLPANHHFLGPVLWEPAVEAPPWPDHPIAYVSLGSSGPRRLHDMALEALRGEPVITGDAVPGRQAAHRAQVVVCNGGTPAVHQALAAGRPVLGLATNMDQHLSMRSVLSTGTGLLIRSDRATPQAIAAAVHRLRTEAHFRHNAEAMAAKLAAYDAPSAFAAIINRASGKRDDRADAGGPPPIRP